MQDQVCYLVSLDQVVCKIKSGIQCCMLDQVVARSSLVPSFALSGSV